MRQFLARAHDVARTPEGEQILRRELVGVSPLAALLFLASQGPSYRAKFVAEILLAVERGPTNCLLISRDVLRNLSRAVLEERVPAIVMDLLPDADDQDYARLSEIIVELRLSKALHVLRSMGRSHEDEEIRFGVMDLDGVENDERRWVASCKSGRSAGPTTGA